MSNENSISNEPWKRLWLPESSWDTQRTLDENFMSDRGTSAKITASFDSPITGIDTLDAFAVVPFLMLLGRPGSGKSFELRQAATNGALGNCEFIEAKEMGATSPGIYLDSLALAPPRRIAIDGLDEALISNSDFIPQLRAWFRRKLDAQGRPLFHLAISCRWADWPVSPIQELGALWSKEECVRLVLAPLRQSDVVETLKRRFGQKIDLFWSEMNRLHLRRVACWPQGLRSLMDKFEDSGCTSIASSHTDAIEDQVLRHCRLADSPDDTKRWSHSAEGVEWRRRVAGRLASAMIFSGKAQLDLEATATNPVRLTVADLTYTDELWEGQHVGVKLADLDGLVHRSGLLRLLADKHRWVFESQVHQEWLAADWLHVQQLDERRLRQLFGVCLEGRWSVAPPLRAVAAWLSQKNKTFRTLLLGNDPLVLLRMDASSLPDSDRGEIIDALLRATDTVRVVDSGIVQSHLSSLNHPNVAGQLSDWLRNEKVSEAVHELAVEIVDSLQCKVLVPLLWELYPNASRRLKAVIAGALYHLAKEGSDDQWRRVLGGEVEIDAEGTLLGAALEIMVTGSAKVPVRDVLRWLIPTHHFEVYGLFEMVARTLHEHLTVDDLPPLFEVLGEAPSMILDSLLFAHDLNRSAVRLAIQEFDQPEVSFSLANYWHRCDAHCVPPHHDLNQVWSKENLGIENNAKRREIVHGLINHAAFNMHVDRKWIDTSQYLVLNDDLPWFIEQLKNSLPQDEWRYALFVAVLAFRVEPDLLELQAAWNKSVALRKLLPTPNANEKIVAAIAREKADSQAKRTRNERAWQLKWQRQKAKFDKDVLDYTEQCRLAHKAGKLVWPGVESVLSARKNGSGPGTVDWSIVSQIKPEEDWMRAAAERYLIERPQSEGFNGELGTYGLLALASCPHVLTCDCPARHSVINNWLPFLMDDLITVSMGTAPEGIDIEHFADIAPDQFIVAFAQIIRGHYLKQGSLGSLSAFEKVWSQRMTAELESIVRAEPLQPAGFFNIMRHLTAKNMNGALEITRRLIEGISSETPRDHQCALIGAAATLFNGRLATEIAPYLKDTEFVKDAIGDATHRLDFRNTNIDLTVWPDHALSALADACWRAFPRLERHRSNSRGFSAVSAHDRAMSFRDNLTATARSKGIIVNIPAVDDSDDERNAEQRQRTIAWHQHEAAAAAASRVWQHLSPSTLFTLVSRPHARLARDNDELLAAVIESLDAWQEHLRAGAWKLFWDSTGRISMPESKIAMLLRDWLKHNLDVVVEREIELTSEDRTDIVVQMTPGDPTLPHRIVVIELKKHRRGNAKERRTRMKTQLVDRYLRERHHEGWTHGLYVVAWTPEPGSNDDNSEALQSAGDSLAAQAVELSQPPFTVSSLVIDARYQGKPKSEAAAKKKAKPKTLAKKT